METITKYLQIFQPLLDVALTLAVPLLAAKLYQLLGVKEAKDRTEIEKMLRDAIHTSAQNALAYALQKNGMTYADLQKQGQLQSVLHVARQYVLDKNPDALRKLGVDDAQLKDIILAKIPTSR